MFLPGFGQLYNRDYFVGFVLMFWELIVNTLSNMNLSIYYAFNGKFLKSQEVLDFQWALFYPSVYAFGAWQAYNKARSINHKLEKKGMDEPEKVTRLDGLFMGMLVGQNLGMQWCLWSSPILGAIAAGVIGAILGLLVDRKLTSGSVKTA